MPIPGEDNSYRGPRELSDTEELTITRQLVELQAAEDAARFGIQQGKNEDFKTFVGRLQNLKNAENTAFAEQFGIELTRNDGLSIGQAIMNKALEMYAQKCGIEPNTAYESFRRQYGTNMSAEIAKRYITSDGEKVLD